MLRRPSHSRRRSADGRSFWGRRARGAAWSAAAASFFLTACGGGPAELPETTRGAILGGELDADHPAVVGLTITHGDGSLGICSGTIIFVAGCSALVLTAAHCVADLDAAGAVKTPVVVLPASSLEVTGGGFIAQDRMLGRTFHAVAVSVADGYDGFIGSPDDVAIVRIVGVTAALPRLAALTPAQDQLEAGSPVALVGFGDAETPDSFGFRRATQKVVAWLNPQFIGFDQSDGHGVCEGDSGGPVLVSVDGGAAVAGVTSFVRGAAGSSCGGGSTTIRIGAHADFIARAAQAIPTVLDCASCTLAELAPGNACGPGTDCTGACADHLRCMDACGDLPCLFACQATPEASAYAAQLERNLSCAAGRCAAICAAEPPRAADAGPGGPSADGGAAASASGGCSVSPVGGAGNVRSIGAWILLLTAASFRKHGSRRRLASSLRLALGAVVLAAGCGNVTLTTNGNDDASDADAHDSATPDDDGADGPNDDAGKGRGSACLADEECGTGFCTDGVCCNVACQGECVTCSQPVRAGVCWPVNAGEKDPRSVCVDEGSETCGHTGTCDGFGSCATYELGTLCAAPTCAAGTLQDARLCNGKGECGPAPTPRGCAPYVCGPASCLKACSADAACAAPAVCVSGSCRRVPSIVLSVPVASPEIGGFYADPTTDDLCPAGSVVVGYDVASTQDPSSDFVDRIRTVCGAVAVSHSSPLAVLVGATTMLEERGFGPGPSTQRRCLPDQIVHGFDGRSGAFVDQLTFRCAHLVITNTEDAVAIGAVSELTPVGGNGGSPQGTIDCGPGSVAVGTRTLADGALKKLALLCASVSLTSVP